MKRALKRNSSTGDPAELYQIITGRHQWGTPRSCGYLLRRNESHSSAYVRLTLQTPSLWKATTYNSRNQGYEAPTGRSPAILVLESLVAYASVGENLSRWKLPWRRATIEIHPSSSEAPQLRSFIPHSKTNFSKNQIASR